MEWLEFAGLIVTLLLFPKITLNGQFEVKGLLIAFLDLYKEDA